MTGRDFTPSLERRLQAALIEQARLRSELDDAIRYGWAVPLARGGRGGKVTEAGRAGFEHRDGQAVLQLIPPRGRERELLIRLAHYTTGRNEAAIISRDTVMAMHAWLGEWLGATWPDAGGAS